MVSERRGHFFALLSAVLRFASLLSVVTTFSDPEIIPQDLRAVD